MSRACHRPCYIYPSPPLLTLKVPSVCPSCQYCTESARSEMQVQAKAHTHLRWVADYVDRHKVRLPVPCHSFVLLLLGWAHASPAQRGCQGWQGGQAQGKRLCVQQARCACAVMRSWSLEGPACQHSRPANGSPTNHQLTTNCHLLSGGGVQGGSCACTADGGAGG